MREDLEIKLVKKYPEIFRDYNGNIMQSAMPWGFDHGDGWYDIIDALCSAIMSPVMGARRYLENVNTMLAKPEDQKAKWNDWMHDVYNEAARAKAERKLQEAEESITVAVQVKEKFGGLRFYIDKGNDRAYALISMAEHLSVRTCEVCGKMGSKTYHTGWHRTLCHDHAVEQYGEAEVADYEKDKESDYGSF